MNSNIEFVRETFFLPSYEKELHSFGYLYRAFSAGNIAGGTSFTSDLGSAFESPRGAGIILPTHQADSCLDPPSFSPSPIDNTALTQR